ncbi:MAG: hypothetical protein E4H13_05325 [Calditrichales bacterium]|nr:MAG: hypothetical protein E4H13_05325 [Calditrichales bacterium]
MYLKNLLSVFILALLLAACQPKEQAGYRTVVGEGKDQITVVVVKGTPYEMGQQLGRLLKDEIPKSLSQYLNLGYTVDPEKYNDQTLDAAWEAVSPYTNERFKEEIKGMAETSGMPLEQLIRAHMIPVVSDYACSGVAVWGEASSNGHLYQIRNLDFTMEGHLQDFPVVVIYIPNQGIPHAVPTFAGYIGAHTGMNAKGIALGEKGASPGREYPFDMNGIHFSTLFRDLLYDADNLDEALDMVKQAPLIKRYYFYIGDGQQETMGAAKIRVSTPDEVKLTIWKDNDNTDEMSPNVVDNAIYYTMKNDVAFKHLTENSGSYDAQKMIELSRAVADDDGNLINVVYDATTLEMWVAFANDMQIAGSQPYVHLNLNDYLK